MLSPIKLFAAPLLALLLCVACRNVDSDDVVATACGHQLLRSEISDLVPDGVSGEDSLTILNNYVNQWVDQTVLLAKAEKNVKTDFSKQMELYRNSLLIYAYEQQIVNQAIDTVVTDAQVRQYYSEHPDDFVLVSPIVKVVYVKLPLEDGNLKKVVKLMQGANMDDEDIVKVQRLSAQRALELSFDYDEWIALSQLRGKVANAAFNDPYYFRKHHYSEVSDSAGTYCVHFFDHKLADEYAPVEVEYDNIKTIILNRRKVEFISRMRQDLRREAEEGGEVTINLSPNSSL